MLITVSSCCSAFGWSFSTIDWLFSSYFSRHLSTRSWYWTTIEMFGELRMTSWLTLSVVSGLYFDSHVLMHALFLVVLPMQFSFTLFLASYTWMSDSLLVSSVIWFSFEVFLTYISKELWIFCWNDSFVTHCCRSFTMLSMPCRKLCFDFVLAYIRYFYLMSSPSMIMYSALILSFLHITQERFSTSSKVYNGALVVFAVWFSFWSFSSSKVVFAGWHLVS